MTMPATAAGPVWPERGWHYRRSLASRVTLLTTMAVGVAVALVSLAAFLTLRLQMQSTLDDSLLNRAKQAADGPVLSDMKAGLQLPSWMIGAADVRIIYITSGQRPMSADQGPQMQLGHQELDVATCVQLK